MQFDWTTFALEIINFLVLVWILQRLLYRPVMNAIARRRTAIETTLAQAQAAEARAQALQQQYEGRLAASQAEKAAARSQLGREIEAERERMLEALRGEIAREREKREARERQAMQDARRRLQEEAHRAAAAFAARLLERLSGSGLTAAICALAVEDLASLPRDKAQALRAALERQSMRAKATSAHPLGAAERTALAGAMERLAGGPLSMEFGVDPSLVAGLSIDAGPWLLRADVRDELQFFAEAAPHGR